MAVPAVPVAFPCAAAAAAFLVRGTEGFLGALALVAAGPVAFLGAAAFFRPFVVVAVVAVVVVVAVLVAAAVVVAVVVLLVAAVAASASGGGGGAVTEAEDAAGGMLETTEGCCCCCCDMLLWLVTVMCGRYRIYQGYSQVQWLCDFVVVHPTHYTVEPLAAFPNPTSASCMNDEFGWFTYWNTS